MNDRSRPKAAPADPAKVRTTVPPSGTHPCDDCGAPFDGGHLLHADTCPVGRSLEESQEADRLWFELHPYAVARRRSLTMIDRDNVLRALSPGSRILGGRVRVVQLAPGVRVRDYSGVIVAGPEVLR